MKTLKSILISMMFLSLNLFAADVPPVGLKEMTSKLQELINQKQSERAIVGKDFVLGKPVERSGFQLILKPESSYKITEIKGTNNYNVKILSYKGITSEDLPGIFSVKVEYVWIQEGENQSKETTGSNQNCRINVNFQLNNKNIDPKYLKDIGHKGFSYKLEYDKSILTQIESKDSFVFERKNNNDAVVKLIIVKPDNDKIVINSDNITKCNSSTSTLPDVDNNEDTKTEAYSSWSNWTACSNQCGTGKQSRTRECLTADLGIPCSQNLYEQRACEEMSGCKNVNMFLERIVQEFDKKTVSLGFNYTHSYVLQYKNIHPSKKLKCKISMWNVTTGENIGEKTIIELLLNPGEISEKYKGRLEKPEKGTTDRWSIFKECSLI